MNKSSETTKSTHIRRRAIALAAGVVALFGAHELKQGFERTQTDAAIKHAGKDAVAKFYDGDFEDGKVTMLTVKESGTTFDFAKSVTKDGVDSRNPQDEVFAETGGSVEKGEQVIVATEFVNPAVINPEDQNPLVQNHGEQLTDAVQSKNGVPLGIPSQPTSLPNDPGTHVG